MIISKKTVTILLFTLVILTGCDSSDNTEKTAPNKPVQRVDVSKASYQAVSHQQTISGTLEAATVVHLYNEVSGKITALPFHEGDAVRKGTIIIRLDDDLIEAELEKAVAQKNRASLDLERLKKLVPKKLASEEDLSTARTELEIATAEVKLQRTLLSKTIVSAPFEGIITERNYEPGDVVAQHSHILTLIDPDSLYVKMQLSESWLAMIDENLTVEITIDALGSTVHQGRISRIHPTIDPNTRKGIAEAGIYPLPQGARAGQLARIDIKSRPVERLLVPSYAVRHDAMGAYVFVIDENNKAHKTYVEKGLQFGNQLEITDGLAVNDRIVTKGFTALRDGIDVEIVTQDQTTP